MAGTSQRLFPSLFPLPNQCEAESSGKDFPLNASRLITLEKQLGIGQTQSQGAVLASLNPALEKQHSSKKLHFY